MYPYSQQANYGYMPVRTYMPPVMPYPFMRSPYPGMYGLGDAQTDEYRQIVAEHFNGISADTKTKIITELASGNYDTLTEEINAMAGEICAAGALDKGKDIMRKYGKWVLAGLAGFILMKVL